MICWAEWFEQLCIVYPFVVWLSLACKGLLVAPSPFDETLCTATEVRTAVGFQEVCIVSEVGCSPGCKVQYVPTIMTMATTTIICVSDHLY